MERSGSIKDRMNSARARRAEARAPRAQRAAATMSGAVSRATSGAVRQFQSPLYHQIFLILKQRILEGELAAGDGVPGEQELAKIHGVSRITAKRALDELAAAGLVVRERGRGTSVAVRAVGEAVRADASGAMDPLIIMGGATDVRVLDCEVIAADRAVAEALEIEGRGIEARRVRLDSIGWARYGFGPDWAVRAKLREIASLNPRNG